MRSADWLIVRYRTWLALLADLAVRCLKSQRTRRGLLRWSTPFGIFALGVVVGASFGTNEVSPQSSERPGLPEASGTRSSGTNAIVPAPPGPLGAKGTIGVAPVAPVRPATRAGLPRHRGTLIVSSRPEGARVFLNNRPAGRTPLVMHAQPVGSRAVRLTLDGYATWSRAISIVANQSTTISARLDRTE